MSLEQSFLTEYRTYPNIALRSLYNIEDSELWLNLFSLLPRKTQSYLLRDIGLRLGRYEEIKELFNLFPYLRDTIAFVYARQFIYNLYAITHTFDHPSDPLFKNVRFNTSVHIHMPTDEEFQCRIRKYIRAINRTTGILSQCAEGYCLYAYKMLKHAKHAKDQAPIEPFDQRGALCLLYEDPPKLNICMKMKRRSFMRLNRTLDRLFDTYIQGLSDTDNKEDLLDDVIYNLPTDI